MKIYRQIEISQNERNQIESLIEELEDIKRDFKRAETNWGIEFLEGTEIAEEHQRINKELADFKQEYEELQNTPIEYEIKEVNEDKIEDADNKLRQLRKLMDAKRNGEM